MRVWDWSETSQTVSLFSRSLGLLRCLAKGSKRANSAFSGGVEMLTLGDIGVIIKPSSELALLTRWDLVEIFPALRKALPAHHAGLYMAELVHRFTADHDPHPGLFDALLAGLRGLDDASACQAALLRFQWAVLNEAGYRPVLDRLVTDNSPLPDAQVYTFDPASGGVVGAGDSASARAELADWRLRRSTLDTLLRVAEAQDGPPGDGDATTRAARFLASYLRQILGSEPATLRLVFPDLSSPTSPGGRR